MDILIIAVFWPGCLKPLDVILLFCGIQVDARFIAELVLVKQAMEQLAELTGYASDGSPDVYIFTFSTLRVRRHGREVI